MNARTIIITSALLSSALSATAGTPPADDWQQQVMHDIPYRLLGEELPFELEYNERVQHELSRYLRSGRRQTAYMLGRRGHYFPIFEHYLKVYQLPDELKYVPLLESRLRADAESPAGASGLWQFMPATARGFGLNVNDDLDERRNPYQATNAAMRYLSDLYREFGDWALALAAYNCGAGRVRRAQRETGCEFFWDIQHALPVQTRDYLPRIIATIYVAKYHEMHGISPRGIKRGAGDFRVFRIHHDIHLDLIAHYCKISLDQLKQLNPGYLVDFVPRQARPHYLILPREALPHFKQYILKESRRTGSDYAIAVLDAKWQAAGREM